MGVGIALLLAVAAAVEGPPLPDRFERFVRGEIAPLSVPHADHELFREYRLRSAYQADYVEPEGRRMKVEAFRFDDSEGAHAAYLYSRPEHSASPMIWDIHAVTGAGVTVMEYRNYMLRFRSALPTVSSALEETLASLPGLTVEGKSWDLSGRFLDESSVRALLGPMSLRRFAGRIPSSIVGFRLGASGRIGRYETPAGPVTMVVFDYPTREIAEERAKALGALESAVARANGKRVGAVFESPDPIMTEELLSDTGGGEVISWDPDSFACGRPLTLDQSIAGLVFWGLIVASAVALNHRFNKSADPFPNRMIWLRL
jgi:hypothetical protein